MRKFIHQHPLTFAVLMFAIAGVGVDLVNQDLHAAADCALVGFAIVAALYGFWGA